MHEISLMILWDSLFATGQVEPPELRIGPSEQKCKYSILASSLSPSTATWRSGLALARRRALELAESPRRNEKVYPIPNSFTSIIGPSLHFGTSVQVLASRLSIGSMRSFYVQSVTSYFSGRTCGDRLLSTASNNTVYPGNRNKQKSFQPKARWATRAVPPLLHARGDKLFEQDSRLHIQRNHFGKLPIPIN